MEILCLLEVVREHLSDQLKGWKGIQCILNPVEMVQTVSQLKQTFLLSNRWRQHAAYALELRNCFLMPTQPTVRFC